MQERGYTMADDVAALKASDNNRFALSSDEDFFGFSEIPFDAKDFTRVQSDIFEKVERALTLMEEDLQDQEEQNREMLSTIMKISAWRNLRECLGASLQHKNEHGELQMYILQCATLFFKELDHSYWSTTQFQFLLHLDSLNPTYWAGYGLCLVEMADRGAIEEFRLEEKAAIAFTRAARLCLAHILHRTGYFSHHSPAEKLIEQALRYYGNAHELAETDATVQGAELCVILKERASLREAESLRSSLSPEQKTELDHVLALKIE
jgi:hypothetical protein